jgi:hypothetical protein
MKIRTDKIISILLIICVIFFISCAPKEDLSSCLSGHIYGFTGGVWHGFIAPVDLIAMIFDEEITVYADNNNGAWYAFGFLIGSGGWGIMGGKKLSDHSNK